MEQNPKTLKELRLERGLAQTDLGPRAMISMIENGHREPGPRVLRRIAARLRMSRPDVMAACRATASRTKGAHAPRRNKVGAR